MSYNKADLLQERKELEGELCLININEEPDQFIFELALNIEARLKEIDIELNKN